jgi:GNAT superfamily N-acetyltransferase
MTPLAQASATLSEALFDDPFYQSITEDFEHDLAARKNALIHYFQYSLEEADRTGRRVLASDPNLGAAAWLLPRSSQVEAAESAAKAAYLGSVLGPRGVENYYRIVRYMSPLAKKVVPGDAWYLSIIGVLPSAQGRGLGAMLLAGTLAEADQKKVTCYLETFTPRNLGFYERMRFRRVAQHLEPTTNREYVVMRRDTA